MPKVDLKRQLKDVYSARRRPALVDVPDMQFLMVDGAGAPEGTEYQQALQALYGVAYPVKMALKRAGVIDYTVMPLEGLWWTPEGVSFYETSREDWLWTAMIMQPDEVTDDLFQRVVEEVSEKKGLPALDKLRLSRFHEGLCAQVLHVGPYSEEGPTIQRLLEFIEEQGLSRRGKHHEIYLGDPRRAAPERLRTIIRLPVE